MADSVSTEAWLDQRRWAALEEGLEAEGQITASAGLFDNAVQRNCSIRTVGTD